MNMTAQFTSIFQTVGRPYETLKGVKNVFSEKNV